jgi:hypothetical protein
VKDRGEAELELLYRTFLENEREPGMPLVDLDLRRTAPLTDVVLALSMWRARREFRPTPESAA